MSKSKNFVLSFALTALALFVAGLLMFGDAAVPVSGKNAPVIASPATITVVASGLNNPRGINFGPDGAFYVTNNSIFSGTGEVLRIEP